MSKKLDPLVSEFETEEQAEAYDRWFRKHVQEAIDDPRPPVPHDVAMKQIWAAIRRKSKKQA